MGYSASQAKEFIKYIAPIICAEADKRGYNIRSAVIAQAIVEGAAGTSSLAKNWHNHFGMKCGKSWKGQSVNLKTKEEYTVGNLVTIRDNFRAYPDDISGISGYYDFINAKRYENLKYAKDYRQYAEYLKADGWATSSSYVSTIISTVCKYNLYTYDLTQPELKPTSEIVKEIMEGKWGNGEERKRRLEQAGYNYKELQAEVNKATKESSWSKYLL